MITWKKLALLAALVLLAHYFILRYGFSGWMVAEAPPEDEKVIEARTIAPPPPPPPPPEPKPEPKPEPVVVAKPEALPKPSPAPVVQTKPVPKPEPKTEAVAVKPAPTPASKAAAKPATAPVSAVPMASNESKATTSLSNADTGSVSGKTDPNATATNNTATSANDAGKAAPAAPAAPPVPTPAPAPAAATAAVDNPATSSFKLPDAMRLVYSAGGKYKFLPIGGGNAELLWKPNGNAYEVKYDFTIPGLGTTTMGSAGTLGPNGIQPNRFYNIGKPGERAAHFQRDKGIISFSNNKPDVALLPGAQDMASLMVYISGLLAGSASQYPAGAVLRVQTATVSTASVWNVRFVGEEEIHPPFGPVKALKIFAESPDYYEYKLEIWYAPSVQYLPVRVLLRANDWYAESNLAQAPAAP